MFIGAHPDDETFFAAGTFAKYVSEGASVSVVCATRGEAGKTGGICSQEELPKVREVELTAAMQLLGVNEIEMLPYIDRQLSTVPIETIRPQLVSAIRRFQPHVVITFDPNGANAHPDHIAINRFATDAIAAAADRRWFPEIESPGTALPHTVSRVLWTPPVMIYKLTPDLEISRQPGFDFIIDTSRWNGQKTAAFQAHATQFPGLKKLFFDDPNGRRTFGMEAFRLAAGPRPSKLLTGDIPADDLFGDLLTD